MIGQKVYEDKFEIQIAQKLKAKKSDSSKIKKLIYFTLLNLSSKLACSNFMKITYLKTQLLYLSFR